MKFKTVKLGQLIVNYDRQRVPLSSRERENRHGKYPYYGATSIMDYVDDFLFDGDYILLGEDGTVINEDGTPVLQIARGKFWCNNHAHVIQAAKDVDFDYLYYLLKNTNVLAIVTGAVQPKISQSNMNNLEVNIFEDIAYQKKIAYALKILDDKIKLNNIINQNLEEQAQVLFKSWFMDYEPFGGTLPPDWESATLSQVIDFQNGYAFKSKNLLSQNTNNSYQVFKQGHILRGGGFNLEGTKSWISISESEHLEKYILHKGDVLMAMTDMKDNVAILGNTALMPVDNQYILNQRVGLLRANGYKGIAYPFIYLLTNSDAFLTDLRSRANSGVQVNLSSTEIKNSKIMIAPETVNSAFSDITKPMFGLIFKNMIENLKLAELRDSFLPKLMSGELDVSAIDI